MAASRKLAAHDPSLPHTGAANLSARGWPAAEVEMRQVGSLIPYARNARKHPPEQVAQIAASMQRFGFTIPLLVAEDGTIIAGHGRLVAAQSIGLTEVPVMVARGWSDEDRRLYTLADNRLAETSEWDPETLRLELDELRLDVGAENLAGIGFSNAEISDLLPGFFDNAGGLIDPDETPKPESAPVSRLGEVWALGSHRIICGSSTDPEVVQNLLGGYATPHGDGPALWRELRSEVAC